MYRVHLQDKKHSFLEAEIIPFTEIFNGGPLPEETKKPG